MDAISGYSTSPVVIILVVGAACFLTGISKGGLGGTLGVLITPLVAMVLPLKEALGLTLLMFILGDVFALAAHWQLWESRLVKLLLAGGVAGVILGTFVLTSVSPLVLRKGLGVFVLLFLIYRLGESYLHRGAIQGEPGNPGTVDLKAERHVYERLAAEEGHRSINPLQKRGTWLGLLAGSTAGLTSTLANSGGPLIVSYLLTQRLEPRVFVATSVLSFAVMNWIKVPAFSYAGMFDFELAVRLAWLAPLVPLGVWVGKRLVNRIDRRWFDRVITALLMVAGVLLLVR